MKDSLIRGEVPRGDRIPRPGDEAQVEMQIVEGKQPQSEDFPRPEQVAEVGAGKSGDMRVGRFAQRPRVLGVDRGS